MSNLRDRLNHLQQILEAMTLTLTLIQEEVANLEERLAASESKVQVLTSPEAWDRALEACSLFHTLERYEIRRLLTQVWQRQGYGANLNPTRLKAFLTEQFGLQRRLVTKADQVVAYAFLVHGKMAYEELHQPQGLLEEIATAIRLGQPPARPSQPLTHREALVMLGLEAPADRETIKARYRKIAKELHPDVGGDRQKFEQIQAAYECLME